MSGAFTRNLEIAQGLEATIRSEISRLSSAGDFNSSAQRVDGLINDLQQKSGALRGQLNSLGADERELYAEEITELDQSCNQFRNQLQSARQHAGAQQQVQSQHDSNMKQGQNILNNFDEALAIGNDTLETQQNTMNTLEDDQKRLNNIEDNLSIVDTNAETGEATATRIYRRQICIRIVAWSIFGVMLALFIFSLAWKFK